MPRIELAENSIKLAHTIRDETKKNTYIAAIFAFANKYLSEDEIGKLLEGLKMFDLAERVAEKVAERVAEKVAERVAEDKTFEIANNALREGATIDFVGKITGLDEATIKRLQAELGIE